MAVYKIFAEKDATIYSDYPTLNSGMDAILELNKNTSLNYASQSSAARILIKFADQDMLDVKNNYIGSSSYSASLKLYLADANALPTDYTIEAYPIYSSWDMGTGRFGDSPIPIDGVSWLYKSAENTNPWTLSGFALGVTGSFTNSNPGGGTWYTASQATQSFGVYINKDIDINVSNMVHMMLSGSIVNEGIIVKTSGSLEFDARYNYKLNFFSRDTNTIYPPVLEFKWDDSFFVPNNTGSSQITSEDIRVSFSNNKGEYNQYEKHKFRLNVRDLYPVRTFTTGSLYTSPKYLPATSYYALKDVKSDLTIIDFDDNYTKISCDSNGSFFNMYMYGLEPERYYKILVKTVIGGSTIIFDNDYIFKVTE
jgi:hypothetical protein